MAIQATLYKPAEALSINIRRVLVDLDAQTFIFQGEQFTKSYSPTSGEWNWFITGINSKLSSIPSISGLVIDPYSTGIHPNPNSWH